MPVGREPRSRARRVLEYVLYTVALAIPVLYFASRYPPVEAWLGRIELRNPIVLDRPDGDAAARGVEAEARTESRSNRVYRCVNDGEVVLSDRPCGNVVETREIRPEDVNVIPSTAFTGMASPPDDVDCESLEARIDALDARRRGATEALAAELAVERDATWQRGRSAGCW